MNINLYDAQNYFRVKLEAGGSMGALTVRGIYMDLLASQEMNVLVWDGKGGNDRRKAIYPGYKAKRKPASDDIWQTIKLLRDVLGHTKIMQICVPGYEADDVIAHMALRLHPHGEVKIMSTDGDLRQLCLIPNVTHMRGSEQGKVPTEYIRLYKATVGDASDNIKGIPGFGEKSWEACDKKKLMAFVTGQSSDLMGVVPNGADSAIGKWMIDHRDEIEVMWKIVGFFDISNDEVNQHTKVGVPNAFKAEELMQEFFI